MELSNISGQRKDRTATRLWGFGNYCRIMSNTFECWFCGEQRDESKRVGESDECVDCYSLRANR